MTTVKQYLNRLTRLFLNDHFILVLIIANAVLIFIQEYEVIPIWVAHFDNIFTYLFTAELLLKIRKSGFRKYWRSGWNRMDFILVSLAFFSIVQAFVGREMIPLTFLLTLRVLRVFKSFRLFRFVPNIASILSGVQRAIKASYMVITAFLVMMFVISILSCSLFKEIAPEYFDNPMNSLYSIFRVFSADGWHEIPDLISSRTSNVGGFLAKIYFVAILFVGGTLGMSLINSIFVETMISGSSLELSNRVEQLNQKIDRLVRELKKRDLTSSD